LLARLAMSSDVRRLRKEAGRWVVAHEHHSFPYVED
jgi:hypothetical protein